MGDRTRDDVVTERVDAGKRARRTRDARRRTREGEGIRTGPNPVSERAPEPASDAWLPEDGE